MVIREDINGDWEFSDWYPFCETRKLENGEVLSIQEWVHEETARLMGYWEISEKKYPYSMEIFSNWKKEALYWEEPQEMIIVGTK